MRGMRHIGGFALAALLLATVAGRAGAGPVAAAPAIAPGDADAARIAARLEARVPSDLAGYFDLYLYVSKAATGPWAQHLYMFRRTAQGHFVFERRFAVSTGRERQEQYFTTTPTGLFELDPDRAFRLAHSAKWHGAPMPHAMFLNYSYRTRMSGVALHAATGRLIDKLGHRASGGCVRLPPQMATALFDRITTQLRGKVPVLAFDENRGTTNVVGRMTRDGQGRPVLARGFRVLVVISDDPGPAPSGPAPS